MDTENKIITIIITIYNQQYYEIKNWLNYKDELSNNKDIQFLFLIDNPNINKNILNLIKKSKAEYKLYDKNYGKFYIVKDACDKNLVKGRFIKICDPDDLILPKSLIGFKEIISNLNKNQNYLILTRHAIINQGYYTNNNFQNKYKILRTFNKLPVNCNTVFSTEIIKKFEKKYKNLSKCSDILLSIEALLQKETLLIIIEKKWFYIYNRNKGISSYNKFSYNKKELKNEYKKLFFDTYKYLKILKKLLPKINEMNYITFPTIYDFKTVNNSLVKGNFLIFKRIYYITKIYKIFKKIKISQGNWYILKLLKYYFLQIFKIKMK